MADGTTTEKRPAEETAPIEPVDTPDTGDSSLWTPRTIAWGALVAIIVLLPLAFRADRGVFAASRVSEIALVFIFAIGAISMNQLIGYLGQISLGHQAFIGVGAFVTANLVSTVGAPFFLAIPVAAVSGAVAGLMLGAVALRLRGLYFAVVTLAYGFVAEFTLFQIPEFTGGGAGLPAPRPSVFDSEIAYYYLVAAIFALVQFLDWRFIRTKAGRAVLAIRDDERVAAVNGINVTAYKLLLFSMYGAVAGLAGALFAHWRLQVVAGDFDFQLALEFVLIVVVGGVMARAGIFIAAAIFTLLPLMFAGTAFTLFGYQVVLAIWVPVIGALLLLVTLIFFPGGIGQQIKPFTDWFAGKPFRWEAQHDETTSIGR